jgi:phosphoglycerol transferase MdoB-like AlkP superfamily enzyme
MRRDHAKRFPELAGLSAEQQQFLLEQARYEVFVTQRRTGRVAIHLIIGLIVGFAITITGWRAFQDTHPLLGFVALAVGFVVALLIYRRLQVGLLRSGLQVVMAWQKEDHPA